MELPTDQSTFGFTPNTNAATANGLPTQEATALGNMAQNQGPPDGVSRSAPPTPTAVLTALAAAGRNPADITLPTAGSQAGGSGGDSPDVAGSVTTDSPGGITTDGTGSGGGGGDGAAGGSHEQPWYNDSWYDWVNPISYAGAFKAKFIRSGAAIGAAFGDLEGAAKVARMETELSRSRRNQALADIIDKDLTVEQSRAAQQAAIAADAKDMAQSATTYAKGAGALAEITGDTMMVVQAGGAVKDLAVGAAAFGGGKKLAAEEAGAAAASAAESEGATGAGAAADGVAPQNVFRGDTNLTSLVNSKGIPKSFLNEAGDLVPASPSGLYKGRAVTVGEHILSGFRRGAKSNSPFTSFTPNGEIAAGYGGQKVTVDIAALKRAIQAGEVVGVQVLEQAEIQELIGNDALLSDYWKNLASKWAARDQEVLLRGTIPSKFIKVE